VAPIASAPAFEQVDEWVRAAALVLDSEAIALLDVASAWVGQPVIHRQR